MPKDFDASFLIKNLTKQISDFGKLQGERFKIKSSLMANEIKGSQNYFWKMKEQQASPEYQQQKALGERFKQQVAGATDPFGATPESQVVAGDKGFKTERPKPKEWIYNQIQKKKQSNMPLSKKEQDFENKYLGISAKDAKLTYNERYDRDVLSAEKGELAWEELSNKYPRKREEIDEFKSIATSPLVSKSPKFREGKGLKALFSGDVARLKPKTKSAIKNIKNENDLQELLANRSDYETAGVDVKAILEYFDRDEDGNKR